MNEIVCWSGNERQRACREILGTQDRSNGYLDCFVRLGTLKDGYTYAHLIAPPLPSSLLLCYPLWSAPADRLGVDGYSFACPLTIYPLDK